MVQRPAVQRSIHQWCENNASNPWEGAVKFGSLETSLLPPSAKATDIEIYRHSDDDSPWLKLQSASLRLRPWLSFRGNIIINDIKIKGLSGAIDLQDPLFAKSNGTRRSAPPIEFESISLDSSNLDLRQKASSLAIKGIQVTITPLKKSHLATLTITNTTLSHPTGAYPVSTKAKARIHGSLLAPESIELLPTSVNLHSSSRKG